MNASRIILFCLASQFGHEAMAIGAESPEIVYSKNLAPPLRGDAFRVPNAVYADLNVGEIFVSDPFNHRLVIFDENGIFRHEISGGSNFRSAADLAVDASGRILVLGGRTGLLGLLELDFDGAFLRELPVVGLPDDLAQLPVIDSFALSPEGDRFYLLDVANQQLWLTDRQVQIERAVDLTMDLTEEQLKERIFGKVDAYGDTVLVSIPKDGRVYLFSLEGDNRGFVGFKGIGPCQSMFPTAAAMDADGKVIVLDKQRAIFMRWDPDTRKCQSEHYGFGNAPGALYQPDDIALDIQGRLYVTQGFEGRVQVYKGATPAPTPPSYPEANR